MESLKQHKIIVSLSLASLVVFLPLILLALSSFVGVTGSIMFGGE
jgi:hypothetical protein